MLQQGVIVAEGDGPAGLLQAGDGGVVIIEQAVMAPGQGAFGSPALMAASKSTGPDSSAERFCTVRSKGAWSSVRA